MKKMFFALMCVICSLTFLSCNKSGTSVKDLDPKSLDNTVEKCWECTYKYAGASATEYMWGTESVVVYAMQQTPMGEWTYKPASAKDPDACEDLNPDADDLLD